MSARAAASRRAALREASARWCTGGIPAYASRTVNGELPGYEERRMTLTIEDRIAITDLINLHGHLTDRGDFAGLPALFIEDVPYDVTALGGGVLTGLAAAQAAAEALGDAAPVAHHVTNIVLTEVADGAVRALSK